MIIYLPILLALLALSSAPAAPAGNVPKGLTAADWNGIRAEYDRHRHAVSSGLSARNPGQRWQLRFDGRGFSVEPDGGQWKWGLGLTGYGFGGGAMRPIAGRARVTTDLNRVHYDWDPTLREWYVNGSQGLEHGFTLRKRPAGKGKLELRLQSRGGLTPVPAAGSIHFTDAAGRAIVTYAGLKVWDADGKPLPAAMKPQPGGLTIEVDEQAARYPITIDPVAQQAYLKASNTAAGDRFGTSVSISGNTVLVGAPGEDSAATGVNGSQADNGAGDSGAAYVFVRSGSTWTQQAYLKASNTGASDLFGFAVALSGDTAVIGAYGEDSNGTQSDNSALNSGAVYVFTRSGTTWTQQAYLKASNNTAGDWFAYSVAVSGDTLVASAPFEDSAATGVNGNQADNSSLNAGAIYVFTRSGGVWGQQAYLKASNTGAEDTFGLAVAISGDTIVAGAYGEDSAATGVNGNQADNSLLSSGAAYVFLRTAGVWSQQAYLKASNTGAGDEFGRSVSVSGDTIVVGAWLESSAATGVNGNQADNAANLAGAAYVFLRSGGAWSQQAYLKASNTGGNDRFGWSVAVAGDTIVVGALLEASNATGVNGNQSNNNAAAAGAAYLFVRNGGLWSQQGYLKASNTNIDDAFGVSVGVSGDTVVVGAWLEASAATGVNGNQADNTAQEAGAAYVYTVPAGLGGLRFVPVTPCRVADTRAGQGTTGNFGPPTLNGNTTRDLPIPTGRCNIPATAQAYALNVTVVPHEPLGYLSLWPTGQSQPLVSTLNSFHGGIVANAAIVPAGAGGSISVFVTNRADVIVDINGYFESNSGFSFYTLDPCRLADTRAGTGFSGSFGPPTPGANSTRSFPLPSGNCLVPSNASAYSLNVTVVPGSVLGYLTIWPTGQTQPFVSTLNSFDGAVVANAALVPAGASGAVSAFVTDSTDIILDTNGYFGASGGLNELQFFPLTPCRVADTRSAGPVMAANETRDFTLTGKCNLPATARAYSVNATVVPTNTLGFLTLWPTGRPRPFVSTLNSFLGRIVANAALVPAGTGGAVSVFVTNETHVILDVNGYFQ
ncbi:MAG: FG-GAP repeat protein [Bryobacteraceae bacterium]|nr:FG-GAP repeat protein [Bryobacteraceae bacterium]